MPSDFENALTEKITRMNVAKEGATSYYVDGVTGNDGANGLTWESAKKTIQAAVDLAGSWSKVFIKPSTYLESVSVATPNISLFGEEQGGVILETAGQYALHPLSSATHFRVENMTIYDSGGAMGKNTMRSDAPYTVVNDVVVHGAPIMLYGSYSIVDGATLIAAAPGSSGIGVQGDYCIVRNSVLGASGVVLNPTSRYCVVTCNTIISSSWYGVYITGAACSENIIIHNNFIGNSTGRDVGTNNTWTENYFEGHTNIDNGTGIATEPWALHLGSGFDYRPVVVRNGWLAAALSGVNANNVANLSGWEIVGDTGAIASGAETDCSAVIGQSGKRSAVDGGMIRGVQTLGAGKKVTVRVYKMMSAVWYLVDEYDVTKDSLLEANIGSFGLRDYGKVTVEHDDVGNNRTFHYEIEGANREV